MNLSFKTRVYAAVLASLLIGCAYQRSVTLSPTGLPEEIFATPQENNYSTSNVALFKFTEPSFAPRMGKEAAQCLYRELLKNRVFLNVTRELEVADIRIENLIKIALSKGYDLLITGDLLYYLDGSLHQPARADEQIRVIEVSTNRTLWYAKAVDIGTAAPYADYILLEGRGAHAPTARTLLKRNAEKFCRMLVNLPRQERSDIVPRCVELRKHDGDSAPSPVPKECLFAEAESRVAQEALEEQPLREERLRQEAKALRENDERERFLNEHIYFEFEKSSLLPEAEEILGRKAKWLAAHPEVSVMIEGHCDERGTNSLNMELGHQRAQSARNRLVNLGIVPERLTTVSYGRQRPIDAGHNEAAWAKNRRAEFVMK